MEKHHHSHHHGIGNIETKNITVAFLLNLSFTIIEIVGGIFTNSVAILSDAAHDFGDTVTLGIAWYFQKLGKRQENEVYTYGYRRYSVLGAFITLFILLSSCVFILWESIPRLFAPQAVKAEGMIFLAIFGILVNGLALLQLRKGHSLNEKVVSLHFLEDVLGWVAVLIGSLVMLFYDLPILDPIMSIMIAVYILFNVYKNLQKTFEILLQRTPHNVDIEEVRKAIIKPKIISDCSDIHVWSLDGTMNVLTANLYFKPDTDIEMIDKTVKKLKHELLHLNIHHVTFESRAYFQDNL